MTKPREILVATTILILSAIFTFLFAGLVPLLPGVVDTPVPLAATLLAASALVAAVGVWRGASWGRWLGIVLGAVFLARDLGFVVQGEPGDLISVVLDLILLFVLLRRWSAHAAEGPAREPG